MFPVALIQNNKNDLLDVSPLIMTEMELQIETLMHYLKARGQEAPVPLLLFSQPGGAT